MGIAGNEPDLVPGNRDNVSLAQIRARGIPLTEQTPWRFGCPVWGSVFDPGLATSTPDTAYYWTVAETGLGAILWRDTVTPGGNYCGLSNLTSRFAGAVCVNSEGVNGGLVGHNALSAKAAS